MPPRSRAFLRRLRAAFPTDVAFNLALLVRNVRPVVQLDFQEAAPVRVRRFVQTFAGMAPAVAWIEHSHGIMLYFPDAPMPEKTRAALRAILSSGGKDAAALVGTALELVCESRDFRAARAFRVMLGVRDAKGREFFFKQQMCVRARDVGRVHAELARYEAVADELGLTATVLKVFRKVPSLRRASPRVGRSRAGFPARR